MSDEIENVRLKSELTGLFRYLERVREEIAAISRPADEEFQFESMGEQLDAIVKATEKATNTIMAATEKSISAVDELRNSVTDPEQITLLDQISGNGNDILEACSFQDITGQRVSKVVKSVTYVEERVNALIDVWGKDEVDSVEVEGEDKTEDEKLLAGPQMEGKGLDQAAIDALFD
ncbi:MAG: protein phosphatase CheZ [Rhodospirillaceae bacterium]|nr:protein phosphatase CheZ [Rhodospirillaceae bacterium]MBL6942218.1 protein phosphatase CheZ [Rhodospirillales bacterium]